MNLLEALAQIRKGKCLTEAQQKLQEVVKTCRATGKAGELTIKLKVKPGAHGEMHVTGTSDGKVPKADVTASLFYDDENGALLRDDPKQIALELEAAQNDAERERISVAQ